MIKSLPADQAESLWAGTLTLKANKRTCQWDTIYVHINVPLSTNVYHPFEPLVVVAGLRAKSLHKALSQDSFWRGQRQQALVVSTPYPPVYGVTVWKALLSPKNSSNNSDCRSNSRLLQDVYGHTGKYKQSGGGFLILRHSIFIVLKEEKDS